MLIKTTDKLKALCERLKKCRFITVDTEFIREKTYYPQVCLIQVGAAKGAWLIDPLASELDLKPFFDILMNKSIIKVFHACRQDLEIFYHLMHKMPTPVFDTQVGAMVCGYGDNVSYQQLVHDYTGITLDKGMRVTDWSARPLSREQQNYALHDVIELKDVYTQMMDQICAKNRLDWIQQEMESLTNPSIYEIDVVHMMGKMRMPFKKPQSIHLCARLCEWREKMAQQKNRPRKYILSDDALLECSAVGPKTVPALEKLRTISDGFGSSEMGQSLLAAIQSGLKEKPKSWPIAPKNILTPSQKNLLEALKLLLNVVAEQESVAPYLVASTDVLTHYVMGLPDISFMSGWRYQVFGKHVEALKRGELVFAFDQRQNKLTCRSA